MYFKELPRLVGFRGCRAQRNINAGVLARAEEFGQHRILFKSNAEYENPFGEIDDYDPTTGLYASYLNTYKSDTQPSPDYTNNFNLDVPELLHFSEDVETSDNYFTSSDDASFSDSDDSDSDDSNHDNNSADTDSHNDDYSDDQKEVVDGTRVSIANKGVRPRTTKTDPRPKKVNPTLETDTAPGELAPKNPGLALDDPYAVLEPFDNTQFGDFFKETYVHYIPVDPYTRYLSSPADEENIKLFYTPPAHSFYPPDPGGYLLLSPTLLKISYAPLLGDSTLSNPTLHASTITNVYIGGRRDREFTR